MTYTKKEEYKFYFCVCRPRNYFEPILIIASTQLISLPSHMLSRNNAFGGYLHIQGCTLSTLSIIDMPIVFSALCFGTLCSFPLSMHQILALKVPISYFFVQPSIRLIYFSRFDILLLLLLVFCFYFLVIVCVSVLCMRCVHFVTLCYDIVNTRSTYLLFDFRTNDMAT